MIFQKDFLSALVKQMPKAFLFAIVLAAHPVMAVDATPDSAKETSADVAKDTPKESMFQVGKSYFARVSDRLADSVSGKSDELINRAMEVIGVRYRWDAELPFWLIR